MIIAVVGPTGVGKTKLSIELAKKYNAIIINADSMQVYRSLDIGTSKITEEEKEEIPHYLFDIVDINNNYTVYDYQKDLRKILDNNKNQNIILVGGTGLYLKAGLYNYEFNEEETKEDFSKYSLEELYNMVININPNTEIHKNNRVRLERFLNKLDKFEKNSDKLLYDVIFIGLSTDRDTLYKKINNRVDNMINNGLIKEVKYFYDKNIRTKPLINGIGYKELYDYFDNKISLEEAIENIKHNSRKYAKRQYTWFNNQMNVNWFNVDFNDFNNTINEVVNFIEKGKQ